MRLLVLLFGFLLISKVSACEEGAVAIYPPILNLNEWEIDSLLDSGEEHMLVGNFQMANNYFTQAISLCENEDDQSVRLCRALFDSSLSLAVLGQEVQALSNISKLNTTLQTYHCQNDATNYFVGGKPLLGDDTISVKECLERVDNTVEIALMIIGSVPAQSSVKVSLSSAVILAGERARSCCRMGGVWKACLQPLLQKWHDLTIWEKQCKKYVEPPCWD